MPGGMIYNAHQPADTTDLPRQKIAPTYNAVNPSLQYSTTFFDLMLSRLHRWRHNGLTRLDLRRTEHTWNPPISLRIINPITAKVEVQGFKSAGGLYMPIERSYYWYRKSSSIKKQDWKSR